MAEQLSSLDAWQIAERFDCCYQGDVNPIDHGGFFYEVRDWESYGYASIVEFWVDPESDETVIECRTVNRPDDMQSLFDNCGMEFPAPDQLSAHVQIWLVQSANGSEPLEDFSGPYVQRFPEDTDEDAIWESVRGWIEQLGN